MTILQAKDIRDKVSLAITEMVRDFEMQTRMRVISLPIQRKESKDRRGYKVKSVHVGLTVSLEGDGTEAISLN